MSDFEQHQRGVLPLRVPGPPSLFGVVPTGAHENSACVRYPLTIFQYQLKTIPETFQYYAHNSPYTPQPRGGTFSYNANTTFSPLTLPSAKYLYPSLQTFSNPPSNFLTGTVLNFLSLTKVGTFCKNSESSRLSSLFRPKGLNSKPYAENIIVTAKKTGSSFGVFC